MVQNSSPNGEEKIEPKASAAKEMKPSRTTYILPNPHRTGVGFVPRVKIEPTEKSPLIHVHGSKNESEVEETATADYSVEIGDGDHQNEEEEEGNADSPISFDNKDEGKVNEKSITELPANIKETHANGETKQVGSAGEDDDGIQELAGPSPNFKTQAAPGRSTIINSVANSEKTVSTNFRSTIFDSRVNDPGTFSFDKLSDVDPLPQVSTEVHLYDKWKYRQIYSRLPLSQQTEFVSAWNVDDGNCYYAAIAHVIYGTDRNWPFVKIQHIKWIEEVQRNKNHPRHDLYNRIMSENVGKTTVADYLTRKNGWTSTLMAQITADLYGIFLVVFCFDPAASHNQERVTIAARGCYNSTHKFIRYSDGHYEPLRPIVDRSSEYQFPKITFEATQGLPESPKIRNRNTDVRHSWRKDYSADREIPERLIPRPGIPTVSDADMALLLDFQNTDKGSVDVGLADYCSGSGSNKKRKRAPIEDGNNELKLLTL